MEKFKFQNGQVVRDKISEFEGTIIGRADYLTGCIQYCLCSKGKRNVKNENIWMDEARLILTNKKTKN